MKIESIVKNGGGQFIQKGENEEITELLTDSRRLFNPKGCLFFAIKGERHDGHDYILNLIAKGVRNFVVSDRFQLDDNVKGVNVIGANDVIDFLQKVAISHRSEYKVPVIGITGSNGKTIVKEWLWQLLSKDQNVIKSPKSYNSQLGVPLSIWQMDQHHELGIFEAGISRAGEMENLQKIIQPSIGIITNVKEAHLENFSNRKEIACEKLKLFYKSEVIVFCADHQLISEEINSNNQLKNKKLVTWSYTEAGGVVIEAINRKGNSAAIKVRYNDKKLVFHIPFQDDASIENSMHCITLMLYMNYGVDEINNRLSNLNAVAMRLEVKHGIEGSLLINDSYNNDLASLHIALDFLNQQKANGKSILIISDLFQSGKKDKELYESIAELSKNKGINQLIGIGEHIGQFTSFFRPEDRFFSTTDEFLHQFNSIDIRGKTILLKGSRKFEFEKISERLQEKAHETVLEVNLSALVHNYNHFKSILNRKTKIMVMVKASSYGAGNFEIANALEYNKVDYLGVAYADEGILLKKAGITVPIMVMNPETSAFDAMIRYDLQPEIYSMRTLHLFLKELMENHYFMELNKPYPIHLKLDTGMHRLGFEEFQLEEAVEFLQANKRFIKVQTVFSHLAASDDKSSDLFTKRQISSFERMSSFLKEKLAHTFDRHILNSSGILRFPKAQYEMVRLGIGLYGLIGDVEELKKLQAVSALRTIISQTKLLKAGESVGYGQNYVLTSTRMIATIPVGYADGLSRKLGNGNWSVLVKDKPAPIVGNVCMDMCMIDITDTGAREGDDVYIFKSQKDLLEISKKLDTIPYEVITGVSSRVKRVFFEE